MSKIKLTNQEVLNNIEVLNQYCHKNKIDFLFIPSFDQYLNEYVPMSNCPRYYVTNFTGSVALVLFRKDDKPQLFIDGRYYEQADFEVDTKMVEVVKVPSGTSILNALMNELEKQDGAKKTLGIFSKRTPYSTLSQFRTKASEVKTCVDFFSLIEIKENLSLQPIKKLPLNEVGYSTKEKLNKLNLQSDEAYYVSSLDTISFFSNCRGYHLPNLSSFLATGILLDDVFLVFLPNEILKRAETFRNENLEFLSMEEDFISALSLIKESGVEKIYYDASAINAQAYFDLTQIFEPSQLIEGHGRLTNLHAIKDAREVKVIESNFDLGNQAIYNTIKKIKEDVENNQIISELDVYHRTNQEYDQLGSVTQSFNTISGVGANSSIIHYGSPQDSVKVEKGEMILIDSGGYFKGGFATDTTRTFIAGTKEVRKDREQIYKEIYSLTLKALIQVQSAVFRKGTKGCALDGRARMAMSPYGYDFNHGLGHGVGIHVHEGGARMDFLTNIEMKPGQLISIEPGIYLPGVGGVRIENIALVKEHPKFENMLCFENLVWIGLEKLLIDESYFTFDELTYLKNYEVECIKRGLSFS